MSDFSLDFIGIGAAKAATTWIAQCFAEHPGICMSDPKELNFFGRRNQWPPSGETHYAKGPKWLSKHFRDCVPGQAKGEYSPAYLNDPESPAIIKKEMPEARLIVSLRNPIDCLYSQYFNFRRQYIVPDSFEGMLKQYPEFIEHGDYWVQLQRFLAEFPRDHLCIVLFDDIQEDPQSTLRLLFEYLGVDSDFVPPSLLSRVNVRTDPKRLWLRDAIANTRTFLRSTPSRRLAREILRATGAEKLANWVERKNWRTSESPPMRNDTRKYLQRRYAQSNRELGLFLNRDLSHWI